MSDTYLVVIGRAENIDVVDLIHNVPAKVDTGAFRSSIHAQNIKIITRNDEQWLTCTLLGHPCEPAEKYFETKRFTSLLIKNSTGVVSERYEIQLKVKIGPKIFNTSFSLSDRSNNIYPVLIGRKALNNRFLVDTAKSSVKRLDLKHLKGIMSAEDEEDLE